MKKFNIDIVINALSKHKLSATTVSLYERANLKAFQECIEDILQMHSREIQIIDFQFQFPAKNHDSQNFQTFLDEKYRSTKDFDNITVLDFQYLYASIIVYLIKNNLIKFNIVGYDELFVFLFENRKEFKQLHVNREMDDDSYYNLRFILNATYGLITSKTQYFLYSDMKINLIADFLKNKIVQMFDFTNCIAGDTDQYFFDHSHKINKDVFELACDDFEKLGLSFSIQTKTVNFNDIRRFQRAIKYQKKK